MDCPKCGYAMTPFDTECPRCKQLAAQGRTPGATPTQHAAPPPPYANPSDPSASGYMARQKLPSMHNTSGMKSGAPAEVTAMGWCWGVFGLGWIWGIANHVTLAIVTIAIGLVPYIGWLANLIILIYLGINGHSLAWENRRFDSFEQFRDTMRVWNMWGRIVFIVVIVVGIGGRIALIFFFEGAFINIME